MVNMTQQGAANNNALREKAVAFWSGGKDSAMALYKAQADPGLNIVGLVSTVVAGKGKTSVHEIAETALERQAFLTGLPLRKMIVGENPANSDYEDSLLGVYRELLQEGISTVIYGDLFLQDIKTYREGLLRQAGLKPLFPLWQMDTGQYMKDFIRLGFKALVCCVNTAMISNKFLNREIDADFLDDLPKSADPAGENGEFHTFCYDGPVFSGPVPFTQGGLYSHSAEFRSGGQVITFEVGHLEIL